MLSTLLNLSKNKVDTRERLREPSAIAAGSELLVIRSDQAYEFREKVL